MTLSADAGLAEDSSLLRGLLSDLVDGLFVLLGVVVVAS